MKMIEINDDGYVWHVPLSAIAAQRARYYVERDKDTTYDEEFSFVMDDDYEGLDWFLNQMDFKDVAGDAVLVERPAPLTEPRLNHETCRCSITEAPARPNTTPGTGQGG